jgi:hypothetical protein
VLVECFVGPAAACTTNLAVQGRQGEKHLLTCCPRETLRDIWLQVPSQYATEVKLKLFYLAESWQAGLRACLPLSMMKTGTSTAPPPMPAPPAKDRHTAMTTNNATSILSRGHSCSLLGFAVCPCDCDAVVSN